MKEIVLTQGKVALVDDEDYEYLNQWKWQAAKDKKTFYAMRKENRDGTWATVKMHRKILMPPEGFQIDHIDRNGLNNQKSNLRICTHGQNQMNRYYPSSTGFKGVHRDSGRYRAIITFNGKRLHLGMFATPEEASLAYNEAARKYQHDFACINEI